MDVNIANSGYWSTSYFKGEVTGVDAPIYTRNLKLITLWSKKFPNGTIIRGGADNNTRGIELHVIYDTHGAVPMICGRRWSSGVWDRC